MARLAISLLIATVSACAPATYSLGSWENSDGECDRLDSGGGMWSREFCRDGRGVIVWAVWLA